MTLECPSPIGLASISPSPSPWRRETRAAARSTSSGGRLLCCASRGRLDDVVRCDGCTHWPQRYTATARSATATFPALECLNAPCPESPSFFPTLLACGLAAAALAAPAALASHAQTTYFEGSNTLLSAKTRPHAIAQMQALGVKALRVELNWYNVAPSPTSATKPAFEATNPGLYAWGEYDKLIAEAQRLNWKVLLTVTSPVPRWATSNKKAPYVTKPDPKAFQEFMTAVGRHFGSQVALYSIWNEPNHPAFLLPQWNTNGTPASPRIYRALYQAGYAGLQAAGEAKPKLLLGETAPTGYTKVNYKREKSQGAAARRRAAGVPARSAVPERQVPEIAARARR